jgi:hypothetical protein
MTSIPQVRRTAGQSIRDEKERLTDNRLIPFYFSCVFAWLLWAWEEFNARVDPKLLLCLAIVVTGVTAIIFGRLFRKFRNLNRGERGERKVAELLDDLRESGYRIVHDIVGNGFNIDHVVIGPAGVFAVETKYRSGWGEIEFRNGEGLFVGGRKEENDPLSQARGNAKAVNQLIKEMCGLYKWVTPLVVFVGDWKIKNKWRDTDTRVFSTDQVVRYFEDQQPELKRSEIRLIASHLERSVKS